MDPLVVQQPWMYSASIAGDEAGGVEVALQQGVGRFVGADGDELALVLPTSPLASSS
ncbi:MAG: hypothetical protein U0800_14285 [Isosphaeraceae bacterium]